MSAESMCFSPRSSLIAARAFSLQPSAVSWPLSSHTPRNRRLPRLWYSSFLNFCSFCYCFFSVSPLHFLVVQWRLLYRYFCFGVVILLLEREYLTSQRVELSGNLGRQIRLLVIIFPSSSLSLSFSNDSSFDNWSLSEQLSTLWFSPLPAENVLFSSPPIAIAIEFTNPDKVLCLLLTELTLVVLLLIFRAVVFPIKLWAEISHQ